MMHHRIIIAMAGMCYIMAHSLVDAAAYINEFHYDNTGTDTGEFIEIAHTDSIVGYNVILYNGNGGASYDTKTLPTSTSGPDSNGIQYSVYEYPQDGIQNGSPDGIALVHLNGTVVQFLSYEGTFAAVGGPANGITSTSIGIVSETSATAVGQSLQLVNGVWVGPLANTKGVANSAVTPVTAPVNQPIMTPAALPLTSPASVPAAGPVNQPVAAPVSPPVTPPVSSPVVAPATSPLAPPVLAPVTSPVIPPVTAPATSPVSNLASSVYINEFHYDNVGVDVDEFIEIAHTGSIVGYSVVLYNGNDNLVYNTRTSPNTTSSPDINGIQYSVYDYSGILQNLQNGSPDGIALVYPNGTVVQFLSYEGTFTAADGPASGRTSIDIGVNETAATVGHSLQLINGAWVGPIANTKGAVNSLVTAPVTTPVNQPVTTPVAPPATLPVSVPMSSPVVAPATTPVAPPILAPVTSPVIPPATAPAASPLAASPVSNLASSAYINEFHYDNVGVDVDEFIEIAHTGSIVGYSVVLYNGNDNLVYNTRTSPNTTSSPDINGIQYSVYDYSGILQNLQNGSPDGIALVYPNGTVVQFLSYEGTFTAADGPASGRTSIDIGVNETAATVGHSLQLINGAWVGPIANTKGAVNSLVTAPVTTPVNQPVTTPVAPPATPPVSVPMSSPVVVPATAPVAPPVLAPVTSPVIPPVTAPAASPVAAPVISPVSISVGSPYINEFHYDNVGIDADEFIEVAHTGSIVGYSVVLYNGNDNLVYNTRTSPNTTSSPDINGIQYSVYEYNGGLQNLQNGSPDGIALVYPNGTVVQFLSYEGTFTAADGPASGRTSIDIGVNETAATIGHSLQLINGAWVGPIANTKGAVNSIVTAPVTTPVNQPVTTPVAPPATLPVSVPMSSPVVAPATAPVAPPVLAPVTSPVIPPVTAPAASPVAAPVSAPIPTSTVSIYINEFHYDNTGTDTGEFIEIAHTSSIAGYTVVLYNGNGFLSYDTKTSPTSTSGPDSNGILYSLYEYPSNGIQNGNPDGIALVYPNGTVAQFLSYGGSFTAGNGPAIGITSIDIGITEVAAPIGQSLQLINGAWVGPIANTKGTANSAVAAPVTGPVGAPVVAPSNIRFIHDIQGTGAPITSPFFVNITAVVTSLFTRTDALNGFWMQEEDVDADADPNTSEGIFVLCSSKCPGTLSVGAQVNVLGNVGQSFTTTQIDASISSGSVTILSINNPLPTPIQLTLPATTSTLLESTFQNVEGMLVNFTTTLAVSEYFELARFGEIVLTESSVPFTYTQENFPSTSGLAAATAALSKRRIVLDDDNDDQNDSITGAVDEAYYYPTGGLSVTNKFRGGDTIIGLTGVMQHAFSAWRVRPTSRTYIFDKKNAEPATPRDVGGTLRVTSFNVLNYFTTLDTTSSSSSGPCGPSGTLDCRGADSAAELARQTAKIVAALDILNPDVAGLIELQNSATDAAVAALVSALNAVKGSGTYNYIPTGIIGGDAIVVGLIYKPSVVTPINNFVVLNSSVNPIFIDTSNRPVLIQTFQQISTGERFTISVCHLKSKGSACAGDADKNDGQGNCPNTRRDAAIALVNFLATDPTSSGDPDHLIVGDLNAYAKEDAISVLKNAGFTDLALEKVGNTSYSYLFDGQRGSLDYVFASPSLLPQVVNATVWNINSDEIPIFDYNDEFLETGEATFERESNAKSVYAPNQLRSSDHDPTLVGLALKQSAPVLTPVAAPVKAPILVPVAGPVKSPVVSPVSAPIPTSTVSIYINEFHYDNTGTDTGEFIEIAHTSSIAGYTVVLYNGNGFLSYDTKTSPTSTSGPDTNGILYSVYEYPSNGIQNGNPDGIALVYPNGTVAQFLSYGGSFTAGNGPAIGITSIDIGITEVAAPIGQSLQLINGAWVGPIANTKGTANSAVAAPVSGPVGAPVVAPSNIRFIHDIQGTGAPITSPFFVNITAVVTSLFTRTDALNGFWMQEEDVDADADPNTSEGIFVLCGSKCPGTLSVGAQVNVLGNVGQSFTTTQIDASIASGSVTILSINNPLPTPIQLTLPAATSTLLESTFQNVEGMLVNFTTTLAVSEYFELARFGEIVLTESSVPFTYTQENFPSTSGLAAATAALSKRRIVLDDDNDDQNDSITGAVDEAYYYPTGGLSVTNKFRGGDTIIGLTGVMQHAFSAWRVRPTSRTYIFDKKNAEPATPRDVGGTLRVTSFNVLNYFTTLDTTSSSSSGPCGPSGTLDCRGADSAAELARQTAKIVAALDILNPDVAGLIELQNSATDAAVAALVSALNAVKGSGTYNYIPTGIIGGDAIVVGLIYKPSVVTPINNFVVLNSSVNPIFIDTSNRPVLIQTFQQISTGERFTISVCHLKSKGSACAGDADKNDGQGNCPNTRRDAAIALVNFLATDPTSSGDPDHLIVGDLNAYAKEDAISVLKNAGFTDLALEKVGNTSYSYLFDGQRGSLDYVFASPSLLPQVVNATVWNINSDEIPIFDYNDEFLETGEATFERESNAKSVYAPNQLRSSDHDPTLVGLALKQSAPVLTPVAAPVKAPILVPVAGPVKSPVVSPVSAPIPTSTVSIYINEFHYDNTGTDTGEFIEIAHTSSIAGYTVVLYNGNGFLSYDTKTSPTSTSGPDTNGILYSVYEYPSNGIQNGNPDGIALVYPNGTVAQFLSYGGSFTAGNGPAIGITSIDIGITEVAAPIGQSLQLINGAWVGPIANTKGTANSAVAAPVSGPVGAPVVAPSNIRFIHDIQGTGAPITSPFFVNITAVVTSLFTRTDALNGFWMQEEDVDADADPNTSEGIFVLCGSKCPGTLSVGAQVNVLGNVGQSFTTTQIDASISSGSVTILSINNPLPTPIQLTLPATTSTLLESTFQNVEGMLVNFTTTLAVSEYFELARFGEIVLTESSVPFTYTQENFPSTSGLAAATAALSKRRIVLDDDNDDQNDSITGAVDEAYYYPTGGLSVTNKFRGGDTIIGLTGVMQHAFSAWRVRPTSRTYIFDKKNAEPATPRDVGGTLRVTSFNVLNYFTTLDTTSSSSSGPCGPSGTLDCRGADSAAELARQTAKIVAALDILNPDVAGLIELQNSATDAAVAALVSALNAVKGSGTYNYIPTGIIGGDAIVVGLIYKPSVVTPINNFVVLNSSVNPIFIDTSNRPVLIQTFQQISTGERFTISVCHLKSKGSACAGDADKNDGQGNCPNTRRDAAIALVNFLATDPTSSGDPDHLIVGDLNAYAKEDAISVLKNAGFTDLALEKVGNTSYSYLFDGQRGSLDYVFASPSLLPQVVNATVWNINSDEIPIFDYNDEFLETGEATFERESNAKSVYAPNQLRSSDHDPTLVGLALKQSAPFQTPVSAPVKAPILVPVAGPVKSPFAAPASQPLTSPVSSPKSPPVAVPATSPVASPIAAPVTVPFSAPAALPVAAPVTAPVASPRSPPVAAPAAPPNTSPITSPMVTPVTAPVTSPVTSPVAAPVSVPVALPVTAPVAAPAAPPNTSPITLPMVPPVTAPVTSPVSPPVAVPVSVPVALPVAAPAPPPMSSPITSPISPPVAVPATSPLAPPVSTPLTSPVAAPVLTPVNPPVTLPISLPVTVNIPVPIPAPIPASLPVPVPVPIPVPVPNKVPVKSPTKSPTKAPTNIPVSVAPTRAPIAPDCGFLGLRFFCPRPGRCGFFRRLFNLGQCN